MKNKSFLIFMVVLFSLGFGVFKPSAYAANYGLPKTGQETSYGANDDADYADPASEDVGYTRKNGTWAGWNADGGRFTDNGDGTITDNATGLMWVANPSTAGVGGKYSWTNAILVCEGLTYAGHSDWRLPNVKELHSIVDYGRYNPSIDTNFFTSESGGSLSFQHHLWPSGGLGLGHK
ncbi:MAG: DUF1566 domain-containing protein [Candidatus Omnitrophica bacterium]|nr:DUF1566 domain-containing protein [Candidatus Omnitrophota bacterium]MBU1785193.1 DUF1566 domain-containing protein [Candidatus Omnitrophota bacterium]